MSTKWTLFAVSLVTVSLLLLASAGVAQFTRNARSAADVQESTATGQLKSSMPVGAAKPVTDRSRRGDAQPRHKSSQPANPLNADRAFSMLEQICAIGPRVSGTAGMARQQELLKAYFEELGGNVSLQEFTASHPQTGKDTVLKNLIVTWHPERLERVLLCAHYDTRPFPDRDPLRSNRRKPFIGANDGASGVALLSELAHHVRDFESPLGIDFVLFDAEELVFVERRDKYFLGSEHFANQYINEPRDHSYRCAILVDMVGDKQLQIFQEKNSLSWRNSRALVRSIWDTAKRLGVREFVPRSRYEVRDDHLALHNIAGIPSCDIIDFDYPVPPQSRGSYWHTTNDTPDKCSGESLAKVGWVILEWLKELE